VIERRNSHKTLRVLSITAIGFLLFDYWFAFAVVPDIEGGLATIFSVAGYGASIDAGWLTFHGYYLSHIVGLLLIVADWRVGRHVLGISVVANLIVGLALGVDVAHPLQIFLTATYYLLIGGVLVASYLFMNRQLEEAT
jgi:hypothetical protein